jgi:hypothetical protein
VTPLRAIRRRLAPVLVGGLFSALATGAIEAQGNGGLQVEPSGRGRTEVSFRRGSARGAARIAIDYGQPHARGRQIVGNMVPYDRVWRTGANEATSFRTTVDLTVGGVRVPRGEYTLYTLATRSGWKLIINRQTGQWGTEYDAKQDLARVDLRQRTLREPVESFTMWLVPAGSTRGTLRMAWGTVELSTEWSVR